MKKPKSSPAEINSKLRMLQATTEEDGIVAELLCEFIDRRNKGESVTPEQILAKAPYPEVKSKLVDVIALADVLLRQSDDDIDEDL